MSKLRILLSLKYPNFRNYFIGHTLSTLGTWIQQVTLAWLVYEKTHSATLLGLIAFFTMVPQLLISRLAGAFIDRVNKQKLLIGLQFLFLFQSVILAFFTYYDELNNYIILGLSLLLGLLTAFDTPLRQSFISDLVDEKNNIANALALNAMIFNCCRFIGPPIAGFLLTVSNPVVCFSINTCSYLFFVIALILMRNIKVNVAKGGFNQLLKEGYIFVFKNRDYTLMMLNVIFLNFTASSYVALLPIFAKDYLKGNETTLGYLWGMAGIGSFVASFYLASMRNFENINQKILINMTICGVGLLLLGFFDFYWSYFFALFLLGMGISIANVSTNIMIQRNTPELYRGRVVSIYTSLRFGFDALGAGMAGLLSTYIGAKQTMLLFSFILLSYLMMMRIIRHRFPQLI